jgi:hypothetical protein
MLSQSKREKERVERMRVKKKDKVVSASVLAWRYSALILLDCMGQRRFDYSDVTATRNIRTAMRRSLISLQKQLTITHCFSK